MSELAALVEDLHLRDNWDQSCDRQGIKEGFFLGHALGSGTQRPLSQTSAGRVNSQHSPFRNASNARLDLWNNISHVEDLQQRLLDPTSHIVAYPPLDLDTRIEGCCEFQKEISNHVPTNFGSLRDEIIESSPAKLTGIHLFLIHLFTYL